MKDEARAHFTLPYEGLRCEAPSEWMDANGHLNSVRYMDVFRMAYVELFRAGGLNLKRHPGAGTLFQAEAHVRYERELLEGDPIRVRSWLVGADAKRLRHFHEMFHAQTGYRAATAEYLHLHIDLESRRVGPMPASLRARADVLIATTQGAPAPEDLGRSIALKLSADPIAAGPGMGGRHG